MSKAFTREDDADQQGDLLPERAIPPHPNLVTAEGLAQIEDATLTRLTEQHNEVRAAGDTAATASTARDMRYWSARRATAQLTEPTPGAQVQFGSRVTLRRPDGSTQAYRIVGIDEADPKKGTLSYVSPLAQALMGKEIGDAVVVGPSEEEIVAIR
jgi:transcription elongation GreA/GreB family factor